MANVAFLGLGVMGFPMAGWLAKKGHTVTVYNRTRAKSDKWREQHGGAVAATPGDAAKSAEIVFSCVGDDADLRAIALGALRRLGGRPGDRAAVLLAPLVRLRARAVVDGDRVTLLREPTRHREAHYDKAEERDVRHCCFLFRFHATSRRGALSILELAEDETQLGR